MQLLQQLRQTAARAAVGIFYLAPYRILVRRRRTREASRKDESKDTLAKTAPLLHDEEIYFLENQPSETGPIKIAGCGTLASPIWT